MNMSIFAACFLLNHKINTQKNRSMKTVVKGIICQKKLINLLFIHSDVVLSIYEFLSSVNQKKKIEEFWLLASINFQSRKQINTMEVNGGQLPALLKISSFVFYGKKKLIGTIYFISLLILYTLINNLTEQKKKSPRATLTYYIIITDQSMIVQRCLLARGTFPENWIWTFFCC